MSSTDENQGMHPEEPEQGELFERVLHAAYPAPDSHAAIALAPMLKGKHLRQSEWLHIGWRLAAAIGDLKKLGWTIAAQMVSEKGRKRPIADYSLPQWVLREVGTVRG
jgi:hypothetical protein